MPTGCASPVQLLEEVVVELRASAVRTRALSRRPSVSVSRRPTFRNRGRPHRDSSNLSCTLTAEAVRPDVLGDPVQAPKVLERGKGPEMLQIQGSERWPLDT